MAGIKVTIEFKFGEEKLERGIIKKVANKFYDRVRFYTPVKTGRLKRGWRVSVSGKRITLRNKVKYASYLNSGQTPARDPSKGLMYARALKDATKWAKSRFDVELKRIASVTLETD